MKKKHIIIILIILVSIVIVIACLGLRGCADTKEGVQSGLEEREEEDNQDDTDTPTNSTISSDTVTEEEFENGSQNSVSGSEEQSEVDKDTNTDSEQNNTSGVDKGTNKNEEQGNTGEVTSKETYTITYVLNYSNATIETETQEVKANEAFTLLIPTVPKGDDYSFVKWVITGTNTEFTNGIFSYNSDISLTAVWEDTYSKNY